MSEKIRLLFLLCLFAIGCAARSQEESQVLSAQPLPVAENLRLPDGLEAYVLIEGLDGPTQMIIGPDGRLWVAELNGAESAGTGRVSALSFQSGERRVVADNLLKPTGIAVYEDQLWVATQRDLLMAPLDEKGMVGEFITIREDIPINGRSNGTLTIMPDDALLYISSGTTRNSAESGRIFRIDLTDENLQSTTFATGLKNAYAHTIDSRGRLWATEIADGNEDGTPPAGEINQIEAGAGFGWPQCTAEGKPILQRDGTDTFCETQQLPFATLPPHATPTGMAIAPWNLDQLLVALWLPGEVITVDISDEPSSGKWETMITGFESPQHLLALADGSLLISDHGAGTIYLITATE